MQCVREQLFSLVSNDAVAYTWSTGAISKGIAVDKAGVYTLRIKDDKNCLSKPTSFEVMVKETPPSPSISLDGTFQLLAVSSNNNAAQFFSWKKIMKTFQRFQQF